MKNEIIELKATLNEILQTQKLILEKLNESTILVKEPKPIVLKSTNSKKSKKKDEFKNQVNKFSLILENGYRIKHKFNLAAIPHDDRILTYLRTNDSKIFDGLRRKK